MADLNHWRTPILNGRKPVLGFRQLIRPATAEPWEYNFERNDRGNQRVSALAIRGRGRNNKLLLALLFVCQMAIVDDLILLPTGILMLQVGLTMILEANAMLQKEEELARLELEELNRLEEEEDWIEQQMRTVMFEWHVLKNKPHTRIRKHYDRDGSVTIYAIVPEPRRRVPK